MPPRRRRWRTRPLRRRFRQVLPKLAAIERAPGAAPMPLIDDMGLTLRGSLPLLVDKLGE
jgi:glutamate synthase domain-containing protein 2